MCVACNGASDPDDRTEVIQRALTWRSACGDKYTLDLAIPLAEVLTARAQLGLDPSRKLSAAQAWVRRSGMAPAIKEMAVVHGDQPDEVAMGLVQALPYVTSDGPGLLPAQLLAVGAGDCDDKAYLAVALLRELRYDAAFWLVVGGQHAGVGMVGGGDGVSVDWQGRRFRFWETTAPGARLGEGELASRHPVSLYFPRR